MRSPLIPRAVDRERGGNRRGLFEDFGDGAIGVQAQVDSAAHLLAFLVSAAGLFKNEIEIGGGAEPPSPGPTTCGPDPAADTDTIECLTSPEFCL